MNRARRIVSITLFATLACTLCTAPAFAEGESSTPAQTGQTQDSQTQTGQTQDAQAQTGQQTDITVDPATQPAATQTPAVATPAPVTYTPKTFIYKVKNGSKWSAEKKNGKTAGKTSKVGNGIKVSYIQLKGSDGKIKKSKDFTLKLNVDGKWTAIKAGKAYSSKSKTIQGIKLKLKKPISKQKDVYYRVYTATYGWLGWAKNGEAAGTTKHDFSIRALQISLVDKGATPKTASNMPCYVQPASISYSLGLVGNKTTLSNTKSDGSTAGKAAYNGKSDRLKVTASSPSFTGGIKYKVRTGSNNNSGWSNWKKNGKTAGKKGKKVQAVKMQLTGKLKSFYNVYYRVYSGDNNWLGWASNGEAAGTGSIGYLVGAIQVQIVPKSSGAPGSTSGAYTTHGVAGKGAQLTMLRKAQKYSSGTDKLILINRSTCKVGVFTGGDGAWKMKYYWTCTVGASGTPTPAGQYTTPGEKVYSFGEEKGYSCYYGTVIRGNYMLHSTLYYPNTRNSMDSTLGAHISHGCIRLNIKNAKWLYDNVWGGTKVVIY